MKFNKAQKKALKVLDLWELVKERVKTYRNTTSNLVTGTRLVSSFNWNSTPEGFDCWERIDNKVQEIIEIIKPAAKAIKEARKEYLW